MYQHPAQPYPGMAPPPQSLPPNMMNMAGPGSLVMTGAGQAPPAMPAMPAMANMQPMTLTSSSSAGGSIPVQGGMMPPMGVNMPLPGGPGGPMMGGGQYLDHQYPPGYPG